LAKAFDRARNWNLCICDLKFADLIEFSDVVAAVRPVMLNGGAIIGFYLNYDATSVAVDGVLTNSISRLKEVPRFYFSGSPSSVRVIREFRDIARSYLAARSFVRAAMCILRLLKLTPQALVANRTEAAIAPEGFSTPPPSCTSVTIEVVVEAIA
jgi:hypothetical protein